jgi:type II secretory pathway component PulK
MDWRDTDDNPRIGGAERAEYIRDNKMVLPSNEMFREIDDLIHVFGMTPELLETIRPYLTTRGTAAPRVNLNTAPEPVLRALPGMTDQVLTQILSLRSQGRRISSTQQIVNASSRGGGRAGGGRGGDQDPRAAALSQTLGQRTTVTTTDIELTFYVQNPTRVQPTRLIALLSRGGQSQANLQWQLW